MRSGFAGLIHKHPRRLVGGLVVAVLCGGVLFVRLLLPDERPSDTSEREAEALPRADSLMKDLFQFWEAFREPSTGIYCDTINFLPNRTCGPSDFYSAAGTGMALMAQCVFAEIGLVTRAAAEQKVEQALLVVEREWPREARTGFYAHFTLIKDGHLVPTRGTEYSTIDSAEMLMGALFAGNYFGGDIQLRAQRLARNVSWSDAIEAPDKPTIYPVVLPETSTMSGMIRPFNEYYILAYMAQLMDPSSGSKAQRYFETYMGSTGPPAGRDGYPVHKSYSRHELLTDNPRTFMSSFIPQFCWFQTKGFHSNPYYAEKLFPAWMEADMLYWDTLLTDETVVWGKRVKGKVFGCGAGQGKSNGYTVNRIAGPEEAIFSAAIMAGFLGAADAAGRKQINVQLLWLYDNNVCVYEKELSTGMRLKVPWRCSINNSEWRSPAADSIDFSTFVLGYAVNFLPEGFYSTYAS